MKIVQNSHTLITQLPLILILTYPEHNPEIQEINVIIVPVIKLQIIFRFYQFSTNIPLLFQDPIQGAMLRLYFLNFPNLSVPWYFLVMI